MALHPLFPSSPYEPLVPEHRWFPADEALRDTAYEKLLPPLVANIRREIHGWRSAGYQGASATTKALLLHWFETEHLQENADGTLGTFRYYFSQREAVETAIWLHEVRQARDKFDLLRFDASGSVSHGMFPENWPRYVLKLATGAGSWTDWVDYWAVDFHYESRKEIIQVAKTMGVDGELPGVVDASSGEFIEFEERWTGAYIFENEWQSFRTRKDRGLELTSASHTYAKPGRYTVAVKVIDIFGNDTMALVPVNVG